MKRDRLDGCFDDLYEFGIIEGVEVNVFGQTITTDLWYATFTAPKVGPLRRLFRWLRWHLTP